MGKMKVGERTLISIYSWVKVFDIKQSLFGGVYGKGLL